MLAALNIDSVDELFADIPAGVRADGLEPARRPSPSSSLAQRLEALSRRNRTDLASFLGAGAYRHHIPPTVDAVLSRGEFYTAYTPYQPEISQGTLQTIYEYQSLLAELTGLDVVSASHYDGAAATAEAALMTVRATGRRRVLASRAIHRHFLEATATYFAGTDLVLDELPTLADGTTDLAALEMALADSAKPVAGVLLGQPNAFGVLEPMAEAARLTHAAGALFVAVVEPVSLAVLAPPGEYGADIAVGEGQPLGIALQYGGPYLGLLAARTDLVRQVPGRLVGRTVDLDGRTAYVMTLRAREQDIRRDKAASNICTNQALCALAATVYIATLGPHGLRDVAALGASQARKLEAALAAAGAPRVHAAPYLNEFAVRRGRCARRPRPPARPWCPGRSAAGRLVPRRRHTARRTARVRDRSNHRRRHRALRVGPGRRGQAVSAVEAPARLKPAQRLAVGPELQPTLAEISRPGHASPKVPHPPADALAGIPAAQLRATPAGLPELAEPEVVRHFVRLSQLNYSVDGGFYPLGSCTMKYNPKINEWVARLPGFAALHPLAPDAAAQGTLELLWELERWLAEISGMHAVSLQPAAGAHGELTGILMIRAFHAADGDHGRTDVIVPDSSHGTNPATASMAGFRTVTVPSGADGDVDLDALRGALGPQTAAVMLTNPSTLGLFEARIVDILEAVHSVGALAYMDGANMNAILGKFRPGAAGFDVMHFNTHKTFSTPHGGGGPGAGPVAVSRAPGAVPARSARAFATKMKHSAWSGLASGRLRSAAFARTRAASACSCARTPTCLPTAATASSRSARTPCWPPTTCATASPTRSRCPSRRPACTSSWPAPRASARRPACACSTLPSA